MINVKTVQIRCSIAQPRLHISKNPSEILIVKLDNVKVCNEKCHSVLRIYFVIIYYSPLKTNDRTIFLPSEVGRWSFFELHIYFLLNFFPGCLLFSGYYLAVSEIMLSCFCWKVFLEPNPWRRNQVFGKGRLDRYRSRGNRITSLQHLGKILQSKLFKSYKQDNNNIMVQLGLTSKGRFLSWIQNSEPY